MLVAAALRALAPFSLVAGSPIFHMVSRTLSTLPVRRAGASRQVCRAGEEGRSRKAARQQLRSQGRGQGWQAVVR